MRDNQVYLQDLMVDFKTWMSELELQEDQVKIFENRLAEVLSKNTEMEVRALGEQFQNKLIRQKEVIDILKHDIGLEQQKYENFAEGNPVAIEHVHFDDHRMLRDRIFTNADIFRGMRNDFYNYIEKWI